MLPIRSSVPLGFVYPNIHINVSVIIAIKTAKIASNQNILLLFE